MNNIRFLFSTSIKDFLEKDADSIFGSMVDNYYGNLVPTTSESWKTEIEIMKTTLSNLKDVDGQIIFEYDIPRLGKRIDVVLLINVK